MAVSLKNRKNTKIVDGPLAVRLFHHGSNTCSIDRTRNFVEIDLCGWDTVTTRDKINAFLYQQGVDISVGRTKGVTYATSRKTGDKIDLSSAGRCHFKFDTLELI